MLRNIKSTLKNSIIYGFGNLSTKVVGFILLPVYTSHLTTSDYGILSLLEISLPVLVTVFGFALNQAFFRWYFDKDYQTRQGSLFFTSLLSMFVQSVLMLLILIPFSSHISFLLFDSVQFSYLIELLIISAVFDIIIQTPNNLLRLQERSILFTVLNIIKLISSLLLTLLFILFFNMKIEGIYYAQIISQLFYIIMLSPLVVKNIEFIFDFATLKKMLIFSMPLLLSSFSILLLNISDRYILKIFTSLSDVGIYSFGYKISNTLQVFVIASVNLAILPQLYRMMDVPDNKRYYSKTMTYYSFGIMFFVLGLSLFGQELIKFTVTNTLYWDSYKIIPLITLSIMFAALKDIAVIGLQINKKTKIIAGITFTIATVNVIVNSIMVSVLGVMGSAISILIIQVLYFIIIYRFAQKQYFVPYEIKKILMIVALGVTLIVLSQFLNNCIAALRIIVKSLFLFSFPVILYWFNFYEKIELETINKIWRKWNNPFMWKRNLMEYLENE